MGRHVHYFCEHPPAIICRYIQKTDGKWLHLARSRFALAKSIEVSEVVAS